MEHEPLISRERQREGSVLLSHEMSNFISVFVLPGRDCAESGSDRRGNLLSKQTAMDAQTMTLITTTGEFTGLAFNSLADQ